MKRSEVVELIFKRLGPVGISWPTCSEVLSILEDAGLGPPPRTFRFKTPDSPVEYTGFIAGSEWDPEEEK